MTTPTQLDRLEYLLLSQQNLINYWSSRIMADITQLQASVAALTAAAAADKQAAEAQALKIDNAIALLQSLNASVAALTAQLAEGNAITQENVDALNAQVSGALTALQESAVTDAASDAALDSAVAANTPADPPAAP